jgi:hypothetical protein
MKARALIWALALSGALCACSSRTETENDKKFDAFTADKSSLLENLSVAPLGTGRLMFTDPLGGFDSREHYILEFRFLEDGAELRLWSHFSSFQRADGVEIIFRRNGDQVQVLMSTPGAPAQALEEWTWASERTPLRLRVEIHNGVAEGARGLVWNDKISRDGLVWSQLDQVHEANALIDSRRLSHLFFSKGQGLFWGLELDRVEVLTAKREAPYVD